MKHSPITQRIGYFPEQPPAPQPPKKPRTDWLRLAALGVCICVFLLCFFLLIRYTYNILISRSASNQLEEVYASAQQQIQETMPAAELPAISPTAAPTAAVTPVREARVAAPAVTAAPSAAELWPSDYPNNPLRRVSPVFYQLQAQNRDIIGWLKIDDILEEPVVQRDNTYYLTHNSLKQKSVTGALFLDEICDLEAVPTQMIIHGHNMKEGAMFGALKKYKVKDAGYFRAHPFIDFNTIYENARYVIFAVAEVDIRAGKPDYLAFWHHSRFASAAAFTEYVQRAKLLSHYRCNVDVQPGDRLLTLSTCTGTDDNKRLIVMARMLREGENELELNMDIYSTTDR